MGRRNWIKCACGAKLHVKKGESMCYTCKAKEKKG